VTFNDADSPITRGLQPFWIRDEFWQNTAVAPGATALASVTPDPAFKGSGKGLLLPAVFLVREILGEGRPLAADAKTPALEGGGFIGEAGQVLDRFHGGWGWLVATPLLAVICGDLKQIPACSGILDDYGALPSRLAPPN
jgi:hypothetical protein